MSTEKPLLIITGASAGIGEKTAEIFLNQGFDVINLSRSPCNIATVTNIAIDLVTATDETIKNKLLSFISNQRRIVLIHNASVCYNDSIKTVTPTHWQDTLRLNVTIPTLLSQWVLPYMTPQSAIIFVGSTLSEKAVPNTCSYTVSKHAITGLMRSICQDLAGKFIHTCCICPGITDTKMLRQRINNDAKTLTQLAQIQSDNRLLQPIEIAEMVFMAATHSVLNGAVLHVNGGQIER